MGKILKKFDRFEGNVGKDLCKKKKKERGVKGTWAVCREMLEREAALLRGEMDHG